MAMDKQWFIVHCTNKLLLCGRRIKQLECAHKEICIEEKEYQMFRSFDFDLSEITNHFCISSFRLNKWRQAHHIEN